MYEYVGGKSYIKAYPREMFSGNENEIVLTTIVNRRYCTCITSNYFFYVTVLLCCNMMSRRT